MRNLKQKLTPDHPCIGLLLKACQILDVDASCWRDVHSADVCIRGLEFASIFIYSIIMVPRANMHLVQPACGC